MSVRPTQFNADGSIDVVFDEQGHSGTIPAAQVQWSTNPADGSHNHNFIVLTCPDGCGASSTHPVGGGAAPVDVQQLFVNKAATGCACGNIDPGNETLADAHVHLLVARMDGDGRYQL